ncbi:MAG: penicillin-binding transpeptidase domain-containing protein [bacterium]
MRIYILAGIVLFAFGWIVYNLIRINVFKYDLFRQKLDYYTTYVIYTNPPRADILDRNNRKIAYNRQINRIVLHKSKYNTLTNQEKKYLKQFLADNLQIYDLESLISGSYVERLVLVKNPTYNEMCMVMENMLYIYGVEVYTDYERVTVGPSVSFVTGYVNVPYKEEIEKDSSLRYYNDVGKSGLELQYDKILRGQLGKIKYLMDPLGQPVKAIESIPPKKGSDLKTTLDSELQQFTYALLKSLCDELSLRNDQPVAGSVILMKTDGEILVLTSYPSFYTDTLKPDCNSVISRYREFSCFYSRAISGEYPAASTFKIITSVAALEEKLITKNTRIYCSGVFYVGSHPFHCFNTAGHGYLDIVDSLAVSCDVFYYVLGYKLGIEKIKKYSELLGLNRPTGIDLPFESGGLIPDKEWKRINWGEEWTSGDDVNISIGQGMGLVTPLQMAVVVATVATGYRPTPFLNLKSKPILKKVDISPDTLRVVRLGLERVVDYGTASVIKTMVKGCKVAGKTGTAEVMPNANNPKGLNNTWFVGYFGRIQPEYVIVVSLEGSGGYGGQYAATLAAKIINQTCLK